MENRVHNEVVRKLQQTRKYRSICEDTLYHVAGWAALRYRAPREVLKAAKRKLHQVYGAYIDQVNVGSVESLVDALSADTTEDALRKICLGVLRCHTSTAERIDIMQDFYTELFRAIGEPRSVADLACGLNPFALPWMPLGRNTRYAAFDIDHRLVSAINSLFAHLGRPQAAECRDILISAPDERADVVLLLKSIPCLDQQKKGVTMGLLQRLRSRHVVLSFPVETLGGRDVGMREYYNGLMGTIVDVMHVPVHKMEYPNEVFYVFSIDQ